MVMMRAVKYISSIIFVLSLSLTASAQPSSEVTADDVSRGISLYRAGDYKRAVELLKPAVKKQKENADAWHYLALAQMQSGDHKASRKNFENAIKLRADYGPSHSGLAFLLLILNDLEKAEREAETATTINPQDTDAHYVLAKLYTQRRSWEAAQQSTEVIIKVNPDHAAALLLKAQSLIGQSAPAWMRTNEHGEKKNETDEKKSTEIIRERRSKLEQAQVVLANYLRLSPNDSGAVWWHEQLEAVKAHARQLKDREDGSTNIIDMTKEVKPTILYREKAKYTEEAHSRGVTGIVKLRAMFADDGTLRDILVIEGLDWGLSWASIEAARKIRFEPAKKDGKSVAVVGYLEFSFHL